MQHNILLFWSKPLNNDSIIDWINTEIELSKFHKLSLLSHGNFQNKIILYTYQNIISNIPDFIQVKDANEIYPKEYAHKALLNGHSIAHISDIVRLLAGIELNGIVLDMDAVMINNFPDIDCFTSTMPAKQKGAMQIKWGKNHKPFIIHDNSWDGKALSAFPIKVHKSINTEIKELIDKIHKNLSEKPLKNTKGWNYIMWTLKEIANKKKIKVFEPLYCCPLPAWKGAGNCYSLEPNYSQKEIFGYTLPSKENIFKNTFVIQHFFESSFKGSKEIQNFWNFIDNTSLVAEKCKYIFGENWKSKFIQNSMEDW